MCGIAGWAFVAPDESTLQRALAALAHRGPDGQGTFSSPRASLGHRRLAVIDLSDEAKQPMANEDGSVVVTFNGEIYNFAALRRELEPHHRFRSNGDTEVIVHGYRQWGIDELLRRLGGMFAFALWDERQGVLHLARDRVGKKPLFYTQRGGGLRFASTLPAVLQMLPSTPALRADAVADYLHTLCVPGDKAIVEGVTKLPPGHHATFDGTTVRTSRYWRLSFAQQEQAPAAAWLDRVERELQRATADRLVSDVPLGVFLSGGVDSSLVTALAAEASSRRLTTIAAGFEETGFDELPWARLVAERLGTDHHEHIIRPQATADLPWLVHTAGEPLGDTALLPTMLLARAAKREVTVVLTGDGGDEGFAGYPDPLIALLVPGYARALPAALRARAPALLARAAAGGGRAGAAARRLSRLAAAAAPALRWRYDMLGEKTFRGWMPAAFAPGLRAALASYDPDGIWDAALAAADGPTFADRVLELEVVTQLPDQFLVKADVGSMAYGIEMRSPLLDASVLELAARIPASMKMRRLQLKWILKQLALRRVPAEAILRRKHGFSLPMGAWFRGPLAGLVDRHLGPDGLGRRELLDRSALDRLRAEHRSGAVDHGGRLWALLVLELWLQMFVDRTLRPTDVLAA